MTYTGLLVAIEKVSLLPQLKSEIMLTSRKTGKTCQLLLDIRT
jgi:hypothetical protein